MIRTASEKDTKQIKELWAYCFDDSSEFIDFYFSTSYKPENTLVYDDKGCVQSCLQLLPYKIQMRGNPVDICYIVGVATWPEYRGKGHVSELLRQAIELMVDRGVYISILLPFQYEFYRRYGWEICYSLLTYKDININIPKIDQSNIQYEKIDINEHAVDLADCYAKFMSQFNGYIARDLNNWLKILKDADLDNGRGYIIKEDSKIKGYILYTIQDKALRILEFIYTDAAAKTALLHLALSHKGQVNRIFWKAPSTDATYLSMKDSRGYLEKEAFVMGRILDVEKAFSGLPADNGSLNIRVNDSFCCKNHRCFNFFSDGRISVQPTKEAPHAEMTIQTLSQLLWGFLDVDTAIFEGLIKCYGKDAAKNLRLMLPEMKTYIIEEY